MDLELRDLDEEVGRALRARAAGRGITLEEEVRRTLEASVEAQREEYRRRLRALQAAASTFRAGVDETRPGDAGA
ncbi:MAG TPA: hypothetical protein VFZ01_19590 [Geminicoccaceae bacterium]